MAADEAQGHYVSHVDSTGRDVLGRVEPTGYLGSSSDWILLENLSWGSGPYSTPQSVAQGWMNSPGHRANVLDPSVRDVAVGIAQGAPSPDGGDGFFYVADFGTRAPQARTSRWAHSPRCIRLRRRLHHFCSNRAAWW